jgi:DNA-binding transcriptional MocR family regulator
VPLGSPYPDPAVFPWARLNQYANSLARRVGQMGMTADLPPGNPELIRQIARRHLENGLPVDASEIIVTTGATEALNLCLQAAPPRQRDRRGITHLLCADTGDRTYGHAGAGD